MYMCIYVYNNYILLFNYIYEKNYLISFILIVFYSPQHLSPVILCLCI